MVSDVSNEQEAIFKDVAAIVTAMTDGEQPFIFQTLESVIADTNIGQIVLCVEEKNSWVDKTIGNLVDDSRLIIVRIPMALPGAIRNTALEHVNMPWVAYCDGDDIWCRRKTHIQRSWADARGNDFVGADHYLINENGKICAFAFARNIPMTSSWLVRTAVMKQYPFKVSLSTGEDGEWWVRTNNLVNKARCPEMLLRYRVRSGSQSSQVASKKRKANVINLANLPVLREIILFITWCIWLSTKREEYIWLKEWNR
jgi:hypothetical protein